VNLRAEDRGLFDDFMQGVIPAARLLDLRGVCASGEGVLFRRGRMLSISFAEAARRPPPPRRSVLKFLVVNYLARPRRRFRRDAIWVVDDWSVGYFHWLADVLPRLFVVKERLGDLVLALPRAYERLGFVADSLRAFRLGGLEFVEPREVLVFDRLIVPTHTAPSGHYNDRLIRQVRDLLLGASGAGWDREEGERVYVSRGGAGRRRIRNEDEVIAVLRAHGFRTVRFEEHALAEQVRIAAGASYLVSNHGAGLTNMLFMRPGAHVLELRHAADRVNNCYFTLASALEQHYFYQTCPAAAPDEGPHRADLVVDVGRLAGTVRSMLAHGRG
jgi:capsular polysaccharide biosynthesis protein